MDNFQSFPINKGAMSLVTYNAISNNTYENIYFKDLDSKFILLSKKLAQYLGLESSEEAIGKTDFDFFTKIHAQQAYNDEQRIIATGEPILNMIETETWHDGSSNYVITSKYPLFDDDDNIIGTWGHSITLNQLQHSPEGASLKAIIDTQTDSHNMITQIDQLTKLKNVKAFFNSMNLTYQKAMNQLAMPNKDHALIMIDINGFSEINDDLGHLGGDSALIFLAKLLEEVIGSREDIFMYGTNSFAVLTEVKKIDEAVTIAKEILRVAAIDSFQHEEWDLHLMLDIGICTFKEALPLGSIYDIINLADSRLAEAKTYGPNAIIYERK